MNNGIWEIAQTKESYKTLSNYIFDNYLDNFKQIALEVLKEEDPAFELPKDQRWATNIYGKKIKSFQSQIEQDLESDNPEILELFQQEGDAITKQSYLVQPE